jgi:hypothetical protein
MHFLPAHRSQEIIGEVLDRPRRLALEQAENRLHVQKCLPGRVVGPQLTDRRSPDRRSNWARGVPEDAWRSLAADLAGQIGHVA